MNNNYQSYALALYSLSKNNQKILKTWYEQADLLKQILMQQVDFYDFINDYTISKYNRKQLMFDFLSKINFDQYLIYWTWIIIDNNQIQNLIPIINHFLNYCNERNDILSVSIYSANKLNSQQQEMLTKKINNITNKPIIMQNIVDPKYIAGIKIQIGAKTYDNTVYGKLNNMKNIIKIKGENNA